MRTRSQIDRRSGFTLVEALLSVVILGVMAAGLSALYVSGLQAIDSQGTAMVLDSHLRSRMEQLLATPFDSLADGKEAVTAGDDTYTLFWEIALTDLNGDSIDEPDAKIIVVTVAETGGTLEAIVVNPQDFLGKI